MKRPGAVSAGECPMLKKVRIAIKTTQRELATSLFHQKQVGEVSSEPSTIELMMEGRYHDDGTRVTISYKEGELTGMKDARTSISFQKSEPHLVTMTRDGAARTAMIFEAGRRHLCIYQTPYMPFELAVATKKVQNRIEENGTLHLVYTAEIKGANGQYTDFTMTLLPDLGKPLGT